MTHDRDGMLAVIASFQTSRNRQLIVDEIAEAARSVGRSFSDYIDAALALGRPDDARPAGAFDYGRDQASDTEPTRIAREIYRSGYRCQNMKDPDKSVNYLKTQIRLNRSWDELRSHDQTYGWFQAMRAKWVEWTISTEA